MLTAAEPRRVIVVQAAAGCATMGDMRNEVLVVLHVLAAVFVVGPLVAVAGTAARQVRGGDVAGLRFTARGLRSYGLASVVVALLGAAMVRDFGQLWIWVSLLLYVLALGLTFALLGLLHRVLATPTGTRAGAVGAAAAAATGGAVSLLFVAIVVLMVLKPI